MMPFRSDVGRVAASMDQALLRVDERGTVVWRNDRFRELAEGDGPTLLGRPLRELVQPPDRSLVDAALTGLGDGAVTSGVHAMIRSADSTSAPGDLKFLRTPSFEEHPAFVTVLVRIGER